MDPVTTTERVKEGALPRGATAVLDQGSDRGLLVQLLADLQSARAPSAAVRVISGTTVSLLDRIAAGTFSERLFYRLNLLHLVMRNGAP